MGSEMCIRDSYTSIQIRIRAILQGKQPEELMKFKEGQKLSKVCKLDFTVQDYLALVDATGRVMRADKKGAIQPHETKLLTKLNLSEKQWMHLAQSFESTFKGAVGKVSSIELFCQSQCYKRRVGLRASQIYLEAS